MKNEITGMIKDQTDWNEIYIITYIILVNIIFDINAITVKMKCVA